MKQVLILICACSFSFPLLGQDGLFSANYHIALPMGKFEDFQQDNSYRGLTIDYYHRFKNNMQLGGHFGWQVFHKKFPRATYVSEDGAITANQWRYTHIAPIVLSARYGWLEEKRLSPYAGAGMGAYMVRQEVWVGLDEFINDSWRYGFFPEAGVRLRVVPAFGFLLGSKYHFILNGQQFDGKSNLHFWDVHLGAYIRLGEGKQMKVPEDEEY